MNKFYSVAVILALLLATMLPAAAAGKDDVSVELSQKKVTVDTNGKEKFESADTTRPGDIVEYVAVYKNKGKTAAKNFLANLPVPQGMEYQSGSAKPAKVSASVDGNQFSTVPLKRKVKLSSGKEEVRDVPPAEYKALRWDLKELGGGKSVTVSARMKLGDNRPATVKK